MTDPAPLPSQTTRREWHQDALLALLALIALVLSGWPAGLLTACAGYFVRKSAAPGRELWLLAGGLLWLAASCATGNRTLFFPFACWLASAVFVRKSATAYLRGIVDSALVMGLFFMIRIQQGARGKVLWMECVAAVTVAGLAVVAEGLLPRFSFREWIVAIMASLLAGLSVIL